MSDHSLPQRTSAVEVLISRPLGVWSWCLAAIATLYAALNLSWVFWIAFATCAVMFLIASVATLFRMEMESDQKDAVEDWLWREEYNGGDRPSEPLPDHNMFDED